MAKKKILGNKYIIEEETTKIIVINKKNERYEVLIDTEDLPILLELKYSWGIQWQRNRQLCYAAASIYQGGGKNNITIYLHRIILNANKEDFIDHINGNTLDNRKSNLRKTENAKNLSNRKGANKNSYTGVRNVHWIEQEQEYWVQIMKNRERFLWKFPATQFQEACEFAEKMRKEIFGEFAGNG